jgi:hypothetical protein
MGNLLFLFEPWVGVRFVADGPSAAPLDNALRYTQQYDAVRYRCQAFF